MTEETRAARVVEVTWEVTRRGRVLPVAVIEPVVLDGARVTRVSLVNAARARELDVGAGDEIVVSREAAVIPTAIATTAKKGGSFRAPASCPACHGALTQSTEDLVCPACAEPPAAESAAAVARSETPPPVSRSTSGRANGGGAPLAASRVATHGRRAAELLERFGFELPDDFFELWDFASRLDPPHPSRALCDPLGIDLVGAFDVLAGAIEVEPPTLPLVVHWRSYMDPPELFTVLFGDIDGEHWGYWLDDPSSRPSWVASYFNNDAFEIDAEGRTLFDAIRGTLERSYDDAAHGLESDRRHADERRRRIETLDRLRERLREHATNDRVETGSAYVRKYRHGVDRRSAVTAQTLDGMGIVVPSETYRRPSVSCEALREVLANGGVDGVIAEARDALSAHLPGTALELAKALWATGAKHRAVAVELSASAYRALDRPLLAHVVETHHRTWRDGTITFANRR